MAVSHQNHFLFSDYYLNELLPEQRVWLSVDSGNIKEVFSTITNLYQEKKEVLPELNESALEDEFIRPILKALGHCFQIQAPTPSSKAPDYTFFAEEKIKNDALAHKGKEAFFSAALAVGDAKKWDRSLDKKFAGPGDPFSNSNPSYQIDFYIRETGLKWGLLTNGRIWRLYHHKTSFKLNRYYEVNLLQLIEQKDWEVFKYFYLFFHKQAFISGVDGLSFLDKVYQESIDYSVGVGEELKKNVFEGLRLLCEGFLKYPNGLDPSKDLLEIHENALIILYRILFILYAESRGLLPVDNPNYYFYSLSKTKQKIKEDLDNNAPLSPTAPANYYSALSGISNIINTGSNSLGVPPYDGGLFDPDKHSFLTKYRVGDSYLAKAIDLLSRAKGKKEAKKAFVDYRDLEVQHLGNIYEGLLEYKCRYANEDIVVIKEKSKERWVTKSQVPSGRGATSKGWKITGEECPAGCVYLETDKGERKSTGSYYTPDYIVKYIVENTIQPLIDRIEKNLKEKIDELSEKAKVHRGYNRQSYQKELDMVKGSFDDEVLKLKILDPAMGSGHFLVRATEFLSEHIATNPYTFDEQAPEDESAVEYWKRRVVEHCIYGVDLNPLAVELAKLSLWLATVAKGKPLSFLDHHLRCGNSLIGAKAEDLRALPSLKKGKAQPWQNNGQLALFDESDFITDIGLAVQDLLLIETRPSDTVDDIKCKERMLNDLDQSRREKYRKIANLWTSLYFGNEFDNATYGDLMQKIKGKASHLPESVAAPILAKAERIGTEKHFFHWEIEFPEVFFNRHGKRLEKAGFDVVMGNPPWGADFDEQEKNYNREIFSEIIIRMVDSFMFFIERGRLLLKTGGIMSKIVPNPFLTQVDVRNLRKTLIKKATFTRIINLGDGVFTSDVTAPSCIFVCIKHIPKRLDFVTVSVADLTSKTPEEKKREIQSGQLCYKTVSQAFYLDTHHFSLITKGFGTTEIILNIQSYSSPLKNFVDGEIQRGISADFNDAFIVSYKTIVDEKLELEKCRKIVTGHSISRYTITFYDEYIIYLSRSDVIDKFPRIKRHLEAFRNDITCKEVENGQHQWFALHRPRSNEIFKSPKLLGLTTTDRLAIGLDLNDFFAMDNLYSIRIRSNIEMNNLYFLAVLNSALMTFIYRYFAQEEQRILPQVKAENMYSLPIRRINFTTPESERERLVNDLVAQYKTAQIGQILNQVEECLPRAEDGKFITDQEKSDVIHDFLAFLAEQMIEMNKEKQAELKNFFSWLKDVHGIDKDSLKPKTYLNKFYELEPGEFFKHLEKNRIKPNPTDYSRIKNAFVESAGKLSPLIQRIEATDRLIDRIVYKLYGLTVEEIRIVEGK